jgi:hypothetical protein
LPPRSNPSFRQILLFHEALPERILVAGPLLKESEESRQLSDCRKEAANFLRLRRKLLALDA